MTSFRKPKTLHHRSWKFSIIILPNYNHFCNISFPHSLLYAINIRNILNTSLIFTPKILILCKKVWDTREPWNVNFKIPDIVFKMTLIVFKMPYSSFSIFLMPLRSFGKSSHLQVFYKKSFFKIFAKFTGKHLYWSLFSIKLQDLSL